MATSLQSKSSRVTGFTLVELLVVIGIISLLMSVLLQSLRKARTAAQSLQCLANLRQIGIGLHMYANENRGSIMPFSGYVNAAGDYVKGIQGSTRIAIRTRARTWSSSTGMRRTYRT